jgi:hypothetical protein
VADVHRWDLQWRYTALVTSLQHGCLCGRGTAQRHAGADAADRKTKRIRVVVVGSGWSACSFIKAMRKDDAQVRPHARQAFEYVVVPVGQHIAEQPKRTCSP